jgi:opacity protein-like surface antigen
MKTNTNFFQVLCAACAIVLGSAVTTECQEPRFYAKLDLGGCFTQDANLEGLLGFVGPGSKVKFDPGFRIGLAGGYQLTDWFAAELEIAGMQNPIRPLTAPYVSVQSAALYNIPIMVNAKFQYRNRSPLTPYIGAGVGVSDDILDAGHIEVPTGPDYPVPEFQGSASQFVFAWQIMAGLRYALTERMGLSLEYRYFWADSPSWKVNNNNQPIGDTIQFGQTRTQVLSLAFDLKF